MAGGASGRTLHPVLERVVEEYNTENEHAQTHRHRTEGKHARENQQDIGEFVAFRLALEPR